MDHQQSPERPDPHAVDPVAMLLRATRDEPDARRRERVRASVHAAWHESLAERRGQHRYPILALAAGITIAVLAAWLLLSRTGSTETHITPTTVATVTTVEGQVLNLGAAENSVARVLNAGDTIRSDERIQTGQGRVGLRLEDGVSVVRGIEVRLDTKTELRIAGLDTVTLARGALYVDTDGAEIPATPHALAVVTPFGTARDIGTRFTVRLEEQSLRVAVRDGEVEVEHGTDLHRAPGGTALVLDPEGGTTRSPIEPYDPTWAWTTRIGPGFELDGASLAEFLDWLSHESGWTVSYGSQDLAGQARSWELNGPPIQGMELEEALAMVMRTNALDFELDHGMVTILGDSEDGDLEDTRNNRVGSASG